MSRIAPRFAELRRANRAAFVPFITAGDPDPGTSFAVLETLAAAGADLIELGVPFSDPMADGPAIQASSLRALKSGMTLAKVLDLVRRFRERDSRTPLVLMGYYNPIHAYGTARFAKDAAQAGADGLITVDLPPEEDDVLRAPAALHGLDIVRLVAPTSDGKRIAAILKDAGGFLYYVSVTGITGTKSASVSDVEAALAALKGKTDLPVAVGFGIRTEEVAARIARFADAVVVGSAIVGKIGENRAKKRSEIVDSAVNFCERLAKSVHAARE